MYDRHMFIVQNTAERVMGGYGKYCYAECYKQCVVKQIVTKLSMAMLIPFMLNVDMQIVGMLS